MEPSTAKCTRVTSAARKKDAAISQKAGRPVVELTAEENPASTRIALDLRSVPQISVSCMATANAASEKDVRNWPQVALSGVNFIAGTGNVNMKAATQMR